MKSDVANISIWRNTPSTNLMLTIFTQGFIFLLWGQRKGASTMPEDINLVQKAKDKEKKPWRWLSIDKRKEAMKMAKHWGYQFGRKGQRWKRGYLYKTKGKSYGDGWVLRISIWRKRSKTKERLLCKMKEKCYGDEWALRISIWRKRSKTKERLLCKMKEKCYGDEWALRISIWKEKLKTKETLFASS